MSEGVGEALANAAQSLRDTAKWLVGGVAATAAGVFTGGSLTNLGSLSPQNDTVRLEQAALGFVLGMTALAIIFGAAIRVLTRESMTVRGLVASTDPEVVKVRAILETRYRAKLTEGNHTLQAYIDAVSQAETNPTEPRNAALLKRAIADNVIFSADGGFLLVRNRFDVLVCRLKWATLLAIAGFGLFAWAANPPKPNPPQAALSLTIQ